MTVLALAAGGLALVPAVMILWNMLLFRRPPRAGTPSGLGVSVIVPARDEADNIGPCLDSIRASVGEAIEILVVDDGSTDATPAIIAAHAAEDPRVRMVTPPPLPPGWAGKPHACLAGARAATRGVLLFVDADVRLTPGAVARFGAEVARQRVALASGFPRERTDTLGEALMVPLIHVLLLGYLPFALMRVRREPGFGAGCGQIMVADAAAYHAIGGHAAVRRTWHDGVTLPRAFRERGHMTGLFDATEDAECRMYAGFGATWRGFGKNAREGLAKPAALPVWTVLLGGGWVLPWVLLVLGDGGGFASRFLWCGLIASLVARVAIALRFRQRPASVLLTPFGIVAMLLLQWAALLGASGRAGNWRGRIQTT
jgi:glycosyltransferase involved in cell wall biosynthesis